MGKEYNIFWKDEKYSTHYYKNTSRRDYLKHTTTVSRIILL
jgi:hypothetical protein